jgi:hypothetical protein
LCVRSVFGVLDYMHAIDTFFDTEPKTKTAFSGMEIRTFPILVHSKG